MTSATTDRRQGLVGNTPVKAPATVVATGNITLSGQQTIDGVAVLSVNSAGVPDRVLCVGQTNPVDNGIWDVSTASWTRSMDANGNYDLTQGTIVQVYAGSAANAGSFWALSTSGAITIGTTALTWARAFASTLGLSSTTDYTAGVTLIGGAARVVDSIAILRTLPKTGTARVMVTGYYAVGDGGGGLYYYDSTDVASADNGGTIIVAADGGRWKLSQTTRVSARQFGAKGDGVTDDTTACQALLNWINGIGGEVHFPAGNYKCTAALTINRSAISSESALTRMMVTGDGKGNTQIKWVGGATQGFAYTGAANGGLSAYIRFADLRLQGDGTAACNGMTITAAAFADFERLVVTGFGNFGWNMTDVLSSSWIGCETRANKFGLFCNRTSLSYPNALTFSACDFGLNTEYGLFLARPTTLVMNGGSVQGNGLGGVGASKFGLQITDGGAEGAVGCSINGTYFESNVGDADIFIQQTVVGTACVYDISSCTFNRIDVANFVTNNVRMDVSNGRAVLNVKNCGFNGFNTYVANAARRYVAVNPTGGTWSFADRGTLYSSATEKPSITGPSDSIAANVTAWIRFTPGASPAIVSNFNIPSVARNGVGDYTFTYGRAMAVATNLYLPISASAGSVDVFSESTTTVRLIFKNLSGVATDFGFSGFAVVGGGDVA